MKITFTLLAVFLLISCSQKKDYKIIPAQSANGNYVAVIEIPGGTNKKIEYNPDTGQFEIDQKNGEDRIIAFLPYVGNYGFIPSTLSDKKQGGDGDALDVLVLSEALNTGDVVEIIPIAMLKLMDEGEEDFKIIAIPADENANVLKINSFEELSERHPAVIEILKLWFINYDTDPLEITDIVSEGETLKYIENNRIENQSLQTEH